MENIGLDNVMVVCLSEEQITIYIEMTSVLFLNLQQKGDFTKSIEFISDLFYRSFPII